MVLNEEQRIKELREKRIAYGISQGRLAVASGITREYFNKIESGKMKPSKELLETLHKELARFNPEVPLTMLFDYVKIRFPTLDIQHIIKDILKLNINYMLHEDYGHYSYTEHYSLGDIFIYTSADEEKGVLLELKGRGCRQFESYLLAQQRSWYDFLMDALIDGGVMKRIDLAINDHTGILDIPELAEKCRKREYIGKSRSYKFYQSGELIKHREDDREYMGRTLYLGSLKSDVYFCIYEKDYEQYVKLGTPLEEADIINRFEIRLRNERAYYAVRDLLTYYDAEQTAFSIINQYVRFVDEEADKRKNDWKLNDRWAWFIGDNRQSLKLTTKPEPYTLDRTLRWVQRQVAPTLKMLKRIDKGNGTDYMKTIEQQAKLTEKHMVIVQNPTLAPAVEKSDYEPKTPEADASVDADTVNDATAFLETFFKLYPTATEKELAYYVLGNVIEPIGRDYLYSELVNPIFIKDGDNVKVKVAVKFIDNQTKATQVSQYELVLHKDSNWKIVG